MNYGFLKDNNGNKIYINDDSIYHEGKKLNEVINSKQDKLIAGTGIEITGENIINNIQGNYSTEEVKIGTWIDGKPLYRKTLNVKLYDNSYGDVSVPYGYIDKIKDVIHIYGTMDYSKESISKIPINSYLDATHYSSFYYYSKEKTLRAFLGKDLAGLKAIINVEYTKTTD